MHIESMTTGPIPANQIFAFEKGCAGKDPYPSEAAAYAALAAMKRGLLGRKRGEGNWDELHAYECVFCNEWHLGH